MKIFLGYIENDKFKKDKAYEFISKNIDYEDSILTPKELYFKLKSDESFIEFLKEIYQNREVGILSINEDKDEIEYKHFWFFRGYKDEHFNFFLNYFNIYFDEEYANREDIEKELKELVDDELEKMKIKL